MNDTDKTNRDDQIIMIDTTDPDKIPTDPDKMSDPGSYFCCFSPTGSMASSFDVAMR